MYMNWGIEGETYNIVDGAPVFTDLITANPDGLSLDQALIQYALAADDFFFCMDPQLWLARMSLPEQREMLPRWANGNRDRILPPVLPTSDEAAEVASIMGEVTTYVNEMFTKFVMGVEPLDNFDTYMNNLKSLGVERAIELKQNQLDRYNARTT
ncbi:MAG TPA: ABC transporter substrate-binding protein, partial [Clostridia bacterium]|nr:ABC transporter substrate-binding protein [Clostridia bacterium]